MSLIRNWPNWIAGCLALVFIGWTCGAQTPALRREYIYLGGRVIAMEESGGGVNVDVWPGTASLGPQQSMRFNAVVTGSSNALVNWSISPSGRGFIDSSTGVYTAPPVPALGESVTVRATSLADPLKSSTATVTFYSPQATSDYPLMGSFLNFYRNFGDAQWGLEFDRMGQISMNTIVVVSVGALKADASDPNGYNLSGEGLLYPSLLVPAAIRPATDRLETILQLADQRGIKVYLGSLQTAGDWTTGMEFAALRDYNKRVAQEIVANYGQHPSLEGWYFTQEIWMNWVKAHVPSTTWPIYYGTALLRDFVTDMATVDPTKPVTAAVVFKKDGNLFMPGLTPSELQSVTTQFLQASGLPILMPQDGGGAEAGAAPIAELPVYFQALKNAADASPAGTALWSTVETFTQVPNLSNDRYPPATPIRIQQQVNQVRPYVSGLVNWIYGNDLSDQATYYPVEASALDRGYRARSRPGQVAETVAHPLATYSSTPAPSFYYPDTGGELANHSGGGLNGYTLTDWAGYPVEETGGVVRITADLGASKPVRTVRALSLAMLNSGIYHPSSMTVETSADGVTYSVAGSSTTVWPNTFDFSVGWTEVPMNLNARYVRCSFAHVAWMFLSELEIVGAPFTPPPPPGSVGISVNPATAQLLAGQTAQFTATVTGSGNTAVNWDRSPAAGSISSTGLYQAPSSVTASTLVTIQAQSQADTSKVATATVTLSPSAPSPDMVGPVNPASGGGQSQLFRFEANARSGNLEWVQFLVHSELSPINACLVYYVPDGNLVLLSKDDPSPYQNDWTEAPVALGTPGKTIQNSQCSIDVANSSASGSASSVAVELSITFKPAFSGTKFIFMNAADAAGYEPYWPYLGYWNVP